MKKGEILLKMVLYGQKSITKMERAGGQYRF